MWDINKENSSIKFAHSNMVTCVAFCLNDENFFVSGCLDKIIRIWDTRKNKVVDYINVQDLITSISFFPSGNQIAVGFHNGKISTFDIYPKLKFQSTYDCKNGSGKYSDGRKVTGIEFINNNEMLVSTNDSRIRLLNIKENRTKTKFKGHENNELMIKAFYDETNSYIISASDDGFIYIWKKEIAYNDKTLKNDAYIRFKPFEDGSSTCSFFLNETDFVPYQKKLLNHGLFIKNVILSLSKDGKMRVIVNPVFID